MSIFQILTIIIMWILACFIPRYHITMSTKTPLVLYWNYSTEIDGVTKTPALTVSHDTLGRAASTAR